MTLLELLQYIGDTVCEGCGEDIIVVLFRKNATEL